MPIISVMEQRGRIQFILPIGNIGERKKRPVTQQAMELAQHLARQAYIGGALKQ